MALKRDHSSSPTQDIFRSSSIEDQKSSFVAAFSPSLSANALQSLPEFKSASHRIVAWRKRSRQKSLVPDKKVLYDLGHDDDGEKWAGSRLQRVLTDTGVEGVVVVARWYGGQNIGPIRFTHIEDCAKQAIWNCKSASEEAKKEQAIKKQKLEDEKSRSELEETLKERDVNISVLRKLLADKNAKLNDSELAPPTPQKQPPNYTTMSIHALKKIDKARDATIGFILKEIDKVDEQLKLVEAFDDSQDLSEDAEDIEQPLENTPHSPAKER